MSGEIAGNFGLDWKIFIAEVINFLIVVGILWYFLYTKIFYIIEKRQKKIDSGLKKSEEADKILKNSKEEASEIISKAKENAKEKINFAIEKAKEKKEELIVKAKEEADKIINSAKENGENEKNKIINSAKDEVAKMIVLGIEKVLQNK